MGGYTQLSGFKAVALVSMEDVRQEQCIHAAWIFRGKIEEEAKLAVVGDRYSVKNKAVIVMCSL